MRSEHDKNALAAVFARLRSDEFLPFRRLLEERIRDKTDTLRNASDTVTVYRMQGQIMALSELLVTVGINPLNN